jgi:MYXO-CTERM domain-containing protein
MKGNVVVLALLVAGCAAEPVANRSQAIIDGQNATDEDFPAVGALMINFLPSCTGTLIAPTVVLTAAHCVDPEFIGDETPMFTLNPNGLGGPLAEIIRGSEARMHTSFDLYREPSNPGVSEWYDIAVLVLAEPIYDVEYGVIPRPEEADEGLVDGVEVDIVGYGQSDVDDEFQAGLKMFARTEVVDVGDFEILTSPPGEPQKCYGDSGGPAFVNMGDGPRIAGIASRGPGPTERCINGTIETRTDAYGTWVATNAPEICDELECDDSGLPIPPSDGGGCSTAGSHRPGLLPLLLALLAFVPRRRRPTISV